MGEAASRASGPGGARKLRPGALAGGALLAVFTLAAAWPSAALAKPVPKPAARPVAKSVPKKPAVQETMLSHAEPVRTELPMRLYSDTFDVFPGLRVDTPAFRRRLERLGYTSTGGDPSRTGSYRFSRSEGRLAIWLHPFEYPDRSESGRLMRMTLDEGGRILSIRPDGDAEVAQFELEPALLTSGEGATREGAGLAAPYFVDFVSRELGRRYSGPAGEGDSVFTTLDPEMQAIAESVVADNVVEMEHDIGDALAKAGEPLQATLIVMDPRTGAIRAMVGGRDNNYTRFNRAIDMRRQPGSTFKSIVALAALGSERVGAAHFTPSSVVVDERMQWEWQGQVWSPRNYEGEFYGSVTIREAIEHSLNSAVARIAKDVGVKPIRDLAVRMGMTPDLGVYPSIVLGGQPVQVLDMAKVFSVYASGGMKVTPHSVADLLDPSGREIAGTALDTHRIVPATDAYLVTHVLEGVMERGTGAVARRKGFKHPAAGKTGTSNDYKDAWFVGFTPNLLAAVWVGFDNNSSMGLPGSEAALPIWTDFMRQALADTSHDSFEVPSGITLVDIDKKDGEIARPECPKQVREAYLSAEAPHGLCDEHGGTWR